jgi:hypothetical protein
MQLRHPPELFEELGADPARLLANACLGNPIICF